MFQHLQKEQDDGRISCIGWFTLRNDAAISGIWYKTAATAREITDGSLESRLPVVHTKKMIIAILRLNRVKVSSNSKIVVSW
jgi:hypothetical protein